MDRENDNFPGGDIEVTPEMIAAGQKALESSGILENGVFKNRVPDDVLRTIFRRMMRARANG